VSARTAALKPTVIGWKKRHAGRGGGRLEAWPKPGLLRRTDDVAIVLATLEPPPERRGDALVVEAAGPGAGCVEREGRARLAGVAAAATKRGDLNRQPSLSKSARTLGRQALALIVRELGRRLV
jgi:hypothetical protein